MPWLLALPLALLASWAGGDVREEAFDGTFRLDSGEVITGGVFVEGGQSRFLYMDTETLGRGGLFERVDRVTLRSTGMVNAEGATIRFIEGPHGGFNRIEWRQPGHDPVPGVRIRPHRSEPIRFGSFDDLELSGRLMLPECEGPHPVVVSVHGSGPVNRHGGTFHTFFLMHGIAVLAYDKRGYTSDPGAWTEPDLEALAADVAAAVRFAAKHPGLDPDRIGVFGSSQAGWVIPPAVVAAPAADFIIIRAGAAVSHGETNLHEVRQELRADGLEGLALDQAVDLRRELYALAVNGGALTDADTLAAPYLDEDWYRAAFGNGPISELWSQRWWQWASRNMDWASADDLEGFDGPVLWFLAGDDENVPLVPTRAALERALRASAGDDHQLVVIPGVPHSFITESPTGEPAYTEAFFGTMSEWLAGHGYTRTDCWSSDTDDDPTP